MPERVVASAELADLLGVLGHCDRIRIIEELRFKGPREVCEIRDGLEIPASRLSQHLTLLKRYRILRESKTGRKVVYHLLMPGLADWLLLGLQFLKGDGLGELTRAAHDQWQASATLVPGN